MSGECAGQPAKGRIGPRGGLFGPNPRFFELFRAASEDGREFFRLYSYVDEKWTLQDIFERGLGTYLQTRTLPVYLHKAAQAIRRCRTAALGGHIKIQRPDSSWRWGK